MNEDARNELGCMEWMRVHGNYVGSAKSNVNYYLTIWEFGEGMNVWAGDIWVDDIWVGDIWVGGRMRENGGLERFRDEVMNHSTEAKADCLNLGCRVFLIAWKRRKLSKSVSLLYSFTHSLVHSPI